MKKSLVFRIVAIVLVVVTLGVAITYAWYINTRKTDSIEIDTTGISISYRINSNTQLNEETVNINNISFFDVTANDEAYYLPTMAVSFKLNVINYSTSAVDVNVYQNTQSYHLGTEIADGVISVYKYTKVALARTDYVKNTHYIYDNDTFVYSSPDSYVSGKDYFTRELLFTATPTITDNKITAVALSNSSYFAVIDGDGLGFAVEEYVEVESLTAKQFTANGSIFYTLENTTYTVAKTYDSTKTYYERRTVAYLSDLTIASSKVTKVDYSVTGAYVECIIVDTTKLTYKDGVYSLPSISSQNKYTTSVNSYLNTNSFTQNYLTPAKLAAGSLNTAGGTKDIYVFVYGVQPYKGATNNFLDNTNNVYQTSLVIKAV